MRLVHGSPLHARVIAAPLASSAHHSSRRARALPCQAIVEDYRPTTADVATSHLQDDNWKQKAARSRLVIIPPSRNPSLPNLNAVVVVEGSRDVFVVRRAVNAPMICIGGTNQGFGKEAMSCIKEVISLVPALIVLVDPDMYGRQYRNAVTQAASQATWHAFLPAAYAVATSDTKYHKAGNVGVEHAHPRHVQQALRNCQRAGLEGLDTFTRQHLQEMRLVQPAHDTSQQAKIDNAALRRELLCNVLGIAKADGKQLLMQLNRYGFTTKQVAEALKIAEVRLPHILALYGALKAADQLSNKGPSADILAYAVSNAVRSALARGDIACELAPALTHARALLGDWGYAVDDAVLDALAPLLAPSVELAASRRGVDVRRTSGPRRRAAHVAPDARRVGAVVRSQNSRFRPGEGGPQRSGGRKLRADAPR